MIRERTGVLLIRVWIDDHDPSTLRARITQRMEVGDTEETVVLAASIDGIEATIHKWLQRFATMSD